MVKIIGYKFRVHTLVSVPYNILRFKISYYPKIGRYPCNNLNDSLVLTAVKRTIRFRNLYNSTLDGNSKKKLCPKRTRN